MIERASDTLNLSKRGIYYIRCSSGYYVGMTTRSFKTRWKEHAEQLVTGTHHNYRLQSAYNRNETMYVGILVALDTKEIIEQAELLLIRYYQSKCRLLNIQV